MEILFLIFLHHLADVAFQPSWLIENKKKYTFALYEHVWIWTGTISLGLYFLDLFTIEKAIFLFLGHFVIDFFMYRILPKDKSYHWVIVDQLLHYLQIYVIMII
jgi:hypothetical protein